MQKCRLLSSHIARIMMRVILSTKRNITESRYPQLVTRHRLLIKHNRTQFRGKHPCILDNRKQIYVLFFTFGFLNHWGILFSKTPMDFIKQRFMYVNRVQKTKLRSSTTKQLSVINYSRMGTMFPQPRSRIKGVYVLQDMNSQTK